MNQIRAAVLTLSDKGSRGERVDESGPALSAWLAERGSEYHAYAVISMCRVLHGLQHGTIVSKPVAARLAQANYPEWQLLIAQALAAQAGEKPGFFEAALAFLRWIRAEIQAQNSQKLI